jgi:hypothetical protein
MLNIVELRLRVLPWVQAKDGSKGSNQPTLTKAPPYASEKEPEGSRRMLPAMIAGPPTIRPTVRQGATALITGMP